MTLRVLVIVVALGQASVVFGQSTPLRVFVDHSGSDSIGVAFVYQLREALQRSSLYPLADVQKNADLVLYIASLDPNEHDSNLRGLSTVIGWTLVASKGVDVLLKSSVKMAGANRVQELAASMIADVDHIVTPRRIAIPASREWQEFEARWNVATEEAASTIPLGTARTAYRDHAYVLLTGLRLAGLSLDPQTILQPIAKEYLPGFDADLRTVQQDQALKACRAELAGLKAPPKKSAVKAVKK